MESANNTTGFSSCRDRDGDLELDYGKYEVEIKWKDHGRKLVVTYDD